MDEAIVKAYDAIHRVDRDAKVGVAHAVNPRWLQRPWRLLKAAYSKTPRGFYVADTAEITSGKFDYYGVNYYCRMVSGTPTPFAEVLRLLCRNVHENYRKPVLVTENGLPNRDDRQKTAYLFLHLKSLSDAMNIDRAEVIGYCWWSFLHGYEWGLGYKPFFGLVDVDIGGSFVRTPTDTAREYSRIIRERGFSLDIYEKEYLPMRSSLKFENWL